MKKFVFLILSFTLFSCFDLIEEVNFNLDGSGDFSYQVNLGKYKRTLENIMRLDSIGKHKIPSHTDIDKDLEKLQASLNKIDGVSNAKCTSDFEFFVFSITGNFKTVVALNKAYTAIYNFKRKEKKAFIQTYEYNNEYFSRQEKDPLSDVFSKNKFLSESEFSTGKVMVVSRFKKEVVSVSNLKTRTSKSKLAILTTCSASQLMKKPSTINCKVKFK